MQSALPANMHHGVRCPRCGYDLRGVVALWTDSCPLEGTCSECGLAFEWARVCCPDKYVPEWCIEYGRGSRAWGGTIRRLLLPWVFWGRLRIEHPPQLWRLTKHIIVLVAVLLLAGYVIVQGSTVIAVYYFVSAEIGRYPLYSQRALRMMQTQIAMIDRIKASDDPVAEYQQQFFVGEELTSEEVDALLASQRQQLVAMLQQAQNASPSVFTMPLWLALGEGIFMPWLDTSFGQATGPPDNLLYPAPSELYHVVPGGAVLDYAVPIGASATYALIVMLVFPVTMLLLVQTRRRTKLLVKHLVRITLYELAALLTVLCVGVVGLQELTLWVDSEPIGFETSAYLALFGAGVLHFIWWFCALRMYARVPHAFFVVLIHLVMSVLLIATVGFFTVQAIAL